MSKKDPECVKVVVRCRPLSRKEVEDQRQTIVEMNIKTGEVWLKNPEADPREQAKPFTFDQVYDHTTQQKFLFETTAQPIIDCVLQGYNGTVFAYGQTGTGKSHTMEGNWEPPELRGIIPRAFLHIFERIEDTHDQNFLVRASYLEIYNEEVRDLLSKDPKNRLEIKEDVERGVYVKDLTSYVVKGVTEMENVLLAGKKNRSVGATLMNQDSSRSHSIFTIVIESSATGADGEKHIRAGKLNLVDLAGLAIYISLYSYTIYIAMYIAIYVSSYYYYIIYIYRYIDLDIYICR
jgi:kinesin family protein 3/17